MTPHPSENSSLASYFPFKNLGFWDHPSLKISNHSDLPRGGIIFILEHHNATDSHIFFSLKCNIKEIYESGTRLTGILLCSQLRDADESTVIMVYEYRSLSSLELPCKF